MLIGFRKSIDWLTRRRSFLSHRPLVLGIAFRRSHLYIDKVYTVREISLSIFHIWKEIFTPADRLIHNEVIHIRFSTQGTKNVTKVLIRVEKSNRLKVGE
jgi:hypothetical protein